MGTDSGAACESVVFPQEGDESVMIEENMLPDDINDRTMDSLDEPSADPFQSVPSDSSRKERLSGASWLHGINKLRGSSPFDEGMYGFSSLQRPQADAVL